MPWWAWLLVDLLLVAGAVGVVAFTGWRFWHRLRAFARAMSRLRAEVPRLPR